MNKNKPDLDYAPSMKWRKKNSLCVQAQDGSLLTLDPRGIINYVRPDSYYLTLGIELEDGREPHDRAYGSPLVNDPVLLYVDNEFDLMRNGYVTEYKLTKKMSKLFIESIVEAIKNMGCSVKIVKNPE